MDISNSQLPCTICKSDAYLRYNASDASVWRCSRCRHAFSTPLSQSGSILYTSDYYEDHHWRWFAYPNYKLFDWIISRIPENASRVIDVGCGKGQFLNYLRKKRPDLELVGIDICDNEAWDGIKYRKLNIENCDDIEKILNKFDVVVSLAVIEHIADPNRYIERVMRLVSDGGNLIVMTVNESGVIYGLSRAIRILGVTVLFDRLYSAHHVNHFSMASLALLMKINGLIIEDRVMHNPPISAVDMPKAVSKIRFAVVPILYMLFLFGRIFGATLLQTLVVSRLPK